MNVSWEVSDFNWGPSFKEEHGSQLSMLFFTLLTQEFLTACIPGQDEVPLPWWSVSVVSTNNLIKSIHLSESNECQFNILFLQHALLSLFFVLLVDAYFYVLLLLFVKVFHKLDISFLNLGDAWWFHCWSKSHIVLLEFISDFCQLVKVDHFFHIFLAKIDINDFMNLWLWKFHFLFVKVSSQPILHCFILFFFFLLLFNWIVLSFLLYQLLKVLVQACFHCIFVVFIFMIFWQVSHDNWKIIELNCLILKFIKICLLTSLKTCDEYHEAEHYQDINDSYDNTNIFFASSCHFVLVLRWPL